MLQRVFAKPDMEISVVNDSMEDILGKKNQINWEVPSPHVLGICSHAQEQCHAKGSKHTTQ